MKRDTKQTKKNGTNGKRVGEWEKGRRGEWESGESGDIASPTLPLSHSPALFPFVSFFSFIS